MQDYTRLSCIKGEFAAVHPLRSQHTEPKTPGCHGYSAGSDYIRRQACSAEHGCLRGRPRGSGVHNEHAVDGKGPRYSRVSCGNWLYPIGGVKSVNCEALPSNDRSRLYMWKVRYNSV